MENLKMYIRKDDLTDYEKENNKISFKRLVERLFTDMVLCNNITKLFYTDINGVYSEPQKEIGEDYDTENDEYIDVYQYFIVDFSSWTYELMKKYNEQFGNEFILYYIDELDMYILGVTHFGTSWDYVLTDIEPSFSTEDTQF
jgi:hypothetical protein